MKSAARTHGAGNNRDKGENDKKHDDSSSPSLGSELNELGSHGEVWMETSGKVFIRDERHSV